MATEIICYLVYPGEAVVKHRRSKKGKASVANSIRPNADVRPSFERMAIGGAHQQ